MAKRVFISYQNDDRKFANQICTHLEHEGISCWIAPRDISAGQEWAREIIEAIRTCSTMLLVLSSNSKDAKQIAREVEIADRYGLMIVTFRLDNVYPPPSLEYFLTNLQWIDGFEGQFESALDKAVKVVTKTPTPQSPQREPVTGPTSEPALRHTPEAVSGQSIRTRDQSSPVPLAGLKPQSGSTGSPAGHFDAPALERVKRELAAYVGPMAGILVDRAAKKAANWRQLYQSLATEVPAGEERNRFLARHLR